jgi:cytochrome c2
MPRSRHFAIYVVVSALLLDPGSGAAQLRGHGGPVRGLAVSTDGATALSGSFDGAAILWDLRRDVAEQVLRFHDSAVNAVAPLRGGRAITAGEDARIALWRPGRAMPDVVLSGHTGPIAALAVSPDGGTPGSASLDRTIRLWPLSGGEPLALEGHAENVNGVAFMPNGKAVVSVGYDATVRIWPLPQPAPPIVAELPAPLAAYAGDPGADVFRACVACHAPTPAEGNRAGPNLHGLFGRHIASLPGYNYSEAFKHLDIFRPPETVAKLFEIGPARYTPGTKMPEQRNWRAREPRGARQIPGTGHEIVSRRAFSRVRADNHRWCAASAGTARHAGRSPPW